MSRVAQQPRAEEIRPKRTPINGRNILTVQGKDPNYVYRIVNADGDRIAQFEEAGYELVEGKDVKVGDRRLDSASAEGSKAQVSVDREGKKAFVMRIRKEWYEEDQAVKAKHVDAIEQTMKEDAQRGNYGKIDLTRD